MRAADKYGIKYGGQARHISDQKSHGTCYGLCGTCAPWIAHSEEEKKYPICDDCLQIAKEGPKHCPRCQIQLEMAQNPDSSWMVILPPHDSRCSKEVLKCQ